MSALAQLHPAKDLVVRMECRGIMEGPTRGTCLGEIATGSSLETITIISPTIHFIPSIVQGLWKSQNHTSKRLIFCSCQFMIAVGWFVDASFRASAFLIMGGVLRVSV